MDNEIKKYLFDIQESISSIEEYLGDKRDFSIYSSNKMLKRAIEREFEIIGEAMNRLNKINPEIQIKSKKKIISMRNHVIHGYDKIDDGVIWGAIVRHLPILKEEVKAILHKQ